MVGLRCFHGGALQAHIRRKKHLDVKGLHLEVELVAGRGLLERDRRIGTRKHHVRACGQPGIEALLHGVLQQELRHAAVGKLAYRIVCESGGDGYILWCHRDAVPNRLKDLFEFLVCPFVSYARRLSEVLLPDPATPVHFEQSSSGYKLAFKMQTFDIEMVLTPDMRLQGATAKGPQSDHFETAFAPGQHGFLLTSWTMTEDGNSDPGHRLIFTYTYQTVDGVQLPEQVVVIRESHHEVWRYRLSGCTVKTTK